MFVGVLLSMIDHQALFDLYLFIGSRAQVYLAACNNYLGGIISTVCSGISIDRCLGC